jgi:hypothetical protein
MILAERHVKRDEQKFVSLKISTSDSKNILLGADKMKNCPTACIQ